MFKFVILSYVSPCLVLNGPMHEQQLGVWLLSKLVGTIKLRSLNPLEPILLIYTHSIHRSFDYCLRSPNLGFAHGRAKNIRLTIIATRIWSASSTPDFGSIEPAPVLWCSGATESVSSTDTPSQLIQFIREDCTSRELTEESSTYSPECISPGHHELSEQLLRELLFVLILPKATLQPILPRILVVEDQPDGLADNLSGLRVHGFDVSGCRVRALHFQKPVSTLSVTGRRIMLGIDGIDVRLRMFESFRYYLEHVVDVGIGAKLNGDGHSCDGTIGSEVQIENFSCKPAH